MIDRDDLLRRTDLAALLDELSPAPATRLGPTARWHCIDAGHDDQHPSITMFVDRRGIERWTCWSGGHGGTAIDALLVARGGSMADVLAELDRRSGFTPDLAQARRIPPRSPAIAEGRVARWSRRCPGRVQQRGKGQCAKSCAGLPQKGSSAHHVVEFVLKVHRFIIASSKFMIVLATIVQAANSAGGICLFTGYSPTVNTHWHGPYFAENELTLPDTTDSLGPLPVGELADQ